MMKILTNNLTKKLAGGVLAGTAMMAFACAASAQSEQGMQQTPTPHETSVASRMKEDPPVWRQGVDLLFVRPLSLAATAVGAGLFIGNLPFYYFERNTHWHPLHTLVVQPGEYTFTRPLGQFN